jgi:hypothetical protein
MSSGQYPTRVVNVLSMKRREIIFVTSHAHAPASSQITGTTPGSGVKITSVLMICFLYRKRYDRRQAVILAVKVP